MAGRFTCITLASTLACTGCTQLRELEDEGSGGTVPGRVQRAFDDSCALSGCHDSTNSGGLNLDVANSVAIIDGPSVQSELPRVELGNLPGSYLAIKVLPQDVIDDLGVERQGSQMPLVGLDLDETREDVAIILGWIAGAELPEGDGTGTDGAQDPCADAGPDCDRFSGWSHGTP